MVVFQQKKMTPILLSTSHQHAVNKELYVDVHGFMFPVSISQETGALLYARTNPLLVLRTGEHVRSMSLA